MQVVFHSNYINHHQRPFVESLVENGCEVIFVAHEEISEERKALGYTTDVNGARYIQYGQDTADEVYRLTMDADAVIFGWKKKNLFRDRVRSGKLTFNYSERLFKKSIFAPYSPRLQMKLRKNYLFDRLHAPYILSAGAYAAQDYRRLGYPEGKFLKWGYFPPMTEQSLQQLQEKKEENTIVWVARFIPLKHPEYIVEMAQYLKKQNIPFHIKMIGNGDLLEKTRKRIQRLDLSDQIELTGAISPEAVREEFDRAKIALLTSGRKEGWGALVNESMGSGCVMVASQSVGSATFLIRDGVSGMTYKNKKELFQKVQQLLEDHRLCDQMGANAYHTIADLWNYRVAAKRCVEFVQDQTVSYTDGPMSKA